MTVQSKTTNTLKQAVILRGNFGAALLSGFTV